MKPIRSSLIVSILVISLLSGCSPPNNGSQNNNSNNSQDSPKIEEITENFSKVNKELSNLRNELLQANTKEKSEEIKSSLTSLSLDTLNTNLNKLNDSLNTQSLKNKFPENEITNLTNDLTNKLAELRTKFGTTDTNKLKKIISDIQKEVNNIDDQIYKAQIDILTELAKSDQNSPESLSNLIPQIFTILLLVAILGLNLFQLFKQTQKLSQDNSSSSEEQKSLEKQLEELQNKLSEINTNILGVKEDNKSNDILSNFSKETLEFLKTFLNMMQENMIFKINTIATKVEKNHEFEGNIYQNNNVNTSELNNKLKVLEILIHQVKEIIDTNKTGNQETNNLIRGLINDLPNFSSSDQTNQIIVRLQAEVQSLKEENTNLNNQYKDLYNKADNTIKDLNSKLQQKEEERNYSQIQLEQIKQERDILKNKLERQPKTPSSESLPPEVDELVILFNQDPQSLNPQYSKIIEVSQDSNNYQQLRANQTKDIIVVPLGHNNQYLIVEVDQTNYLVPKTNAITIQNEDLAQEAFVSNFKTFPKQKFQLIKPAKVNKIDNNKWQVIEKGELYF